MSNKELALTWLHDDLLRLIHRDDGPFAGDREPRQSVPPDGSTQVEVFIELASGLLVHPDVDLGPYGRRPLSVEEALAQATPRI
jgi:hypothetical protein